MATVTAVVRVLGVVTGPLLARALGPAGRGMLAAIIVPFTFAPWIAGLGLPSYAGRDVARGRPLGVVIASVGSLSLALATVGVVVALPLAGFLAQGRDVVDTYLTLGFLVLPAAVAADLLVATAVGLERWNVVIAARLTPALLGAGGIVVLFVVGQLTVGSAAVVTIASTLSSLAPLARVLRGAGSLHFELAVAVDALRFGAKTWIGTLTSLANRRLDQLLMIPLVDPHELGLYAVAVSLASVTGILTLGVATAITPRVAQGERALSPLGVRRVLAIVTLFVVAGAVLTPWVLPLLFGGDFRGAVPMAWILLAAAIPLEGASLLSQTLTAVGRPGVPAAGQLLALLVTVPGLLLLLPPLGGIGAALVSLLAYGVYFSFLLRAARRSFDAGFRDFVLIGASDISWARNLLISWRRHVGRCF